MSIERKLEDEKDDQGRVKASTVKAVVMFLVSLVPAIPPAWRTFIDNMVWEALKALDKTWDAAIDMDG